MAWGEATGHHHRFECDDADVQLLEAPDGTLWLRVNKTSPLVHEEHRTLSIEPGVYRYLPQREYVPDPVQQVRRVTD
ncbi:MAG TPA: hypothetical protein VGO93_11290 [Candidatus Xenobia bacterium]